MENIRLFEKFTDRLNSGKFSYVVTGSIASIYYGLPRLTHDVDIILDMPVDRVDDFIRLFSPDEFYVPPKETIIEETTRSIRGHFNMIDLKNGFKADFYLVGKDSLHRWALKNKKELITENHIAYIAPPEYVIVRKLEYYQEGESDKHLDDIRNIIEISSDLIDFELLEREIGNRGIINEWRKVKE